MLCTWNACIIQECSIFNWSDQNKGRNGKSKSTGFIFPEKKLKYKWASFKFVNFFSY